MSEDLKDLRALWTSDDLGDVDVAKLSRREAGRTRRAMIVEWLAGASVVGFWGIQIALRPHPITWVLGIGSCVFVVVWLVAMHRTLQIPESATSTREYVHQQIAVARAEARWFGFVRQFALAFSAFAVPIGAWKFIVDRAMYEAEPWRAVVGFGGFAVIVVGLVQLAKWRRGKAEGLATALAEIEARIGANE